MVGGYEVKEIKKYAYSVFSSRQDEGEILSDIMLSSDSAFLGYAHFLADGSVLPKATKKFNLYNLYYHQKDLPAVIDMLRNEKPVFIIFADDDHKNCRITTVQENIGEGED